MCSAAAAVASDSNQQPGSDSLVSQPTSRLMNVVLYVERRVSREYNQRVCQVTLTEEVRNSILRPQNGGKKNPDKYIFKGSGREMFVTLLGRELKCEPSKNCTRSYASK